MDAGAWLTLVSIVSGVGLAIVGGFVRWLFRQIDEHQRDKETQRTEYEARLKDQRQSYEAKLDLAERALETKQETVDELRRQVDRYQITAEIQDRFFKQIPPPPPSGER